MRTGWIMLIVSILTRMGVVILLCLLALMTEYLNLKQAYNNPRLVELSHGPKARAAYEAADKFLGRFGDPLEHHFGAVLSSRNRVFFELWF